MTAGPEGAGHDEPCIRGCVAAGPVAKEPSDDISMGWTVRGVCVRLAVYNATERYHGFTTGIGKHVNNVVRGLGDHVGYDVNFCVPSDHWDADKKCTEDDPLFGIPSQRIPISRRSLALAALLTDRPTLEELGVSADWIYSPREVLAPTHSALTAVTIHDIYQYDQPRRTPVRLLIQKVMWEKAMKRATFVATVSQFSKSRIASVFGIDAAKIEVIGNGVEPGFFEASKLDPRECAQITQPYVFSIGGFTRKKGAKHLLSLARLLVDHFPDMKLVVVGPVEPEYRMPIALAPNILSLDRITDDRIIARWMRGAQAIAVLSEYEGFGIPALEGMAVGIPVLVNCKGALPEIVGDSALVIDANQPAHMQAALQILTDTSLRSRLVSTGSVWVQNWTWAACVARLTEAFERWTPLRFADQPASFQGTQGEAK